MCCSFIRCCFFCCQTIFYAKVYYFVRKKWFNLFIKPSCSPTFIVKNTVSAGFVFSDISKKYLFWKFRKTIRCIGNKFIIFRKQSFFLINTSNLGYYSYLLNQKQSNVSSHIWRMNVSITSLSRILTEKTVLLNSVKEFIEIEAWLLLNVFLRLHNPLISIHSIVTYLRIQMLEKCDSANRPKLMVASCSISARFTAKFELLSVLTQENAFS